jgi:hypothetical protein
MDGANRITVGALQIRLFGFPQRLQILKHSMQARVMVDHQLLFRNPDIDSDVVQIALLPFRALDYDPATRHAVKESLEAGDFLQYRLFQSRL